jgi:hypothetical protein
MLTFWFNVIVPKGNVLTSHQEQKQFSNKEEAYKHFFKLCQPACREGYYYLCEWGFGPFPQEKVFGSATPTPRKVLGADPVTRCPQCGITVFQSSDSRTDKCSRCAKKEPQS